MCFLKWQCVLQWLLQASVSDFTGCVELVYSRCTEPLCAAYAGMHSMSKYVHKHGMPFPDKNLKSAFSS